MYQNRIIKRLFAEVSFRWHVLAVSVLFCGVLAATQAQAEETLGGPEKEPKYLFENYHPGMIVEAIEQLVGLKYEVTDYLDDVGDRVDRFLGDETLEIQRKGSKLKLYFPVTFYDNGTLRSRPNFRVYIDLPRWRKRVKFLISSFDESDPDVEDDGIGALESKPVRDDTAVPQRTTFAAQYLVNSSANFLLQFDVGLKFDETRPNPYIRWRHRYRSKFDSGLTSRTSQDFIYERMSHFVWKITQVFDYPTEHNLFRSETRGTWLYDEDLYELRQRGTVFYQINPHRIRSYFIEVKGNIHTDIFNQEQVTLGMNWREKLYQEWLFAEMQPRVSWYVDDDFEQPDFSISFMLEMLFSKS